MSDVSQTPESPNPNPEPRRRRPWYRRRWFMVGVPLTLVGLFAAKGFAHGFRHRHGFGRELSQEELVEHAKDLVAIAARRLDATPEQRKRLEALASQRVPQLAKQREEAHALREKLQEAAKRDDRAAMEQLRKEGLALADRASKEWLTTYGQLADILTPAQRAELLERFDRRHGHGHGPHEQQPGRGHK